MNYHSHSIIRQDHEKYSSLQVIACGDYSPTGGRPLIGDPWLFPKAKVLFGEISTAMCFNEIFATESNFPYAFDVKHKPGLYVVLESSYMDRIANDMVVTGGLFESHKHYVFWSADICWNITASAAHVSSIFSEPTF